MGPLVGHRVGHREVKIFLLNYVVCKKLSGVGHKRPNLTWSRPQKMDKI